MLLRKADVIRMIYRNPPIIEALCEFRFDPGEQWDWAVPGLVYEQLRDEFPLREPRQQVRLSVVRAPGEGEGAGAAAPVQTAAARVRFIREDRTAMVQVGENLLVINQLRPYPGWNRFRTMITRTLAKYRQAAQPERVAWVSLRYINRIEVSEIDGKAPPLQDYVIASPRVPEELTGRPMMRFLQRVEIPFPERVGTLILQSGSVEAEKPDHIAFVLDLDFVTVWEGPQPLSETSDWLNEAHEQVEHFFEVCVTNKARELFGGAVSG